MVSSSTARQSPPSAWDRAQREFDCRHESPAARRVLTVFTASNGVQHLRLQCTRCGQAIRTLRKEELTPQERAGARPFDEDLRQRWNDARSERFRALQREEEDRQQRDWATRYAQYLRSPAWRARRAKVLRRARGVCEGCGIRPAVQAHHLTYDRVGDEMLFDLVAVCRECHEKIHDT